MISRVSAIFEVDLKDFRDALDSMEIYSTSYIEKIRSKSYTEEEIFDIFKHIHRQTSALTHILISMIKKASMYRPTNIALQNFLNHLGSYVSYMTSIIVTGMKRYKENPIYGIRSINKALRDIAYYVKVVKKELNDAIEEGLFV